MDPDVAYNLIHNELQVQSNPVTNMASFVTTKMDEQCDRLIKENLGVNYIDTEVYRGALEMHDRCVKMLGNLFNAPDEKKLYGIQSVGSSEALGLAMLVCKRIWQNKRKAQGKSIDKPNIIMGNNVHITWNKFCNYFEIEPRLIPLCSKSYTVSAEDVQKRIDENTIAVIGVFGSSYTLEYDDIKGINDMLVDMKKKYQLDIPLHVDGASGAFIAPFLNPEIEWDFRLEQVKSINVSGHKFGFTYPGVGWIFWKNKDDIPADLFAETNVLGFVERTFSFNFSRGAAMIIAQYYNLIRLGKQGYKNILFSMRENARYLASGLQNTGKFDIINDAEKTPCVVVRLKDSSRYNVSDLSSMLAQRTWTVPAFSLPPSAEHVHVMRMVCKHTFSRNMADLLLKDFLWAIARLESKEKSKSCISKIHPVC